MQKYMYIFIKGKHVLQWKKVISSCRVMHMLTPACLFQNSVCGRVLKKYLNNFTKKMVAIIGIWVYESQLVKYICHLATSDSQVMRRMQKHALHLLELLLSLIWWKLQINWTRDLSTPLSFNAVIHWLIPWRSP